MAVRSGTVRLRGTYGTWYSYLVRCEGTVKDVRHGNPVRCANRHKSRTDEPWWCRVHEDQAPAKVVEPETLF